MVHAWQKKDEAETQSHRGFAERHQFWPNSAQTFCTELVVTLHYSYFVGLTLRQRCSQNKISGGDLGFSIEISRILCILGYCSLTRWINWGVEPESPP